MTAVIFAGRSITTRCRGGNGHALAGSVSGRGAPRRPGQLASRRIAAAREQCRTGGSAAPPGCSVRWPTGAPRSFVRDGLRLRARPPGRSVGAMVETWANRQGDDEPGSGPRGRVQRAFALVGGGRRCRPPRCKQLADEGRSLISCPAEHPGGGLRPDCPVLRGVPCPLLDRADKVLCRFPGHRPRRGLAPRACAGAKPRSTGSVASPPPSGGSTDPRMGESTRCTRRFLPNQRRLECRSRPPARPRC